MSVTKFHLNAIRENAIQMDKGINKLVEHFKLPEELTSDTTLARCLVAEAMAMADAIEAARATLDRIRTLITTDPRDWSIDRRDAWLWGVFVGWDEASLAQIAPQHRWSNVAIQMLKEQRETIASLEAPTTDDRAHV